MTLAPEIELLVLCLREEAVPGHVSEAIADRAEAIDDWEPVLRAAIAHSLTPVLIQGLEISRAFPSLPTGVQERLRSHHRAGVERGLSMTAELVHVSEALAAEGLRFAAFKGPMLSSLLYGDVAMREYVDLDFLIHPRDLMSAVGHLIRRGFRTELSLTSWEVQRLGERGNEIAFRSEADTIVELEWAIAPSYFGIPVMLADVIDRAQWVSIGGVDLPTPQVEDLLLLLCIHGGKHLWERLAWIRDIAALIRGFPSLDATLVLDRAAEAHVRRMVVVGLWLAELVVGVGPPAAVHAAMAADPKANTLAIELRSALGSAVPARTEPDPPFRPMHLLLRERRRDRALHVGRLALSPTLEDWRAVRLPSGLSLGYYLIRPFRLLGKYVFGRG